MSDRSFQDLLMLGPLLVVGDQAPEPALQLVTWEGKRDRWSKLPALPRPSGVSASTPLEVLDATICPEGAAAIVKETIGPRRCWLAWLDFERLKWQMDNFKEGEQFQCVTFAKVDGGTMLVMGGQGSLKWRSCRDGAPLKTHSFGNGRVEECHAIAATPAGAAPAGVVLLTPSRLECWRLADEESEPEWSYSLLVEVTRASATKKSSRTHHLVPGWGPGEAVVHHSDGSGWSLRPLPGAPKNKLSSESMKSAASSLLRGVWEHDAGSQRKPGDVVPVGTAALVEVEGGALWLCNAISGRSRMDGPADLPGKLRLFGPTPAELTWRRLQEDGDILDLAYWLPLESGDEGIQAELVRLDLQVAGIAVCALRAARRYDAQTTLALISAAASEAAGASAGTRHFVTFAAAEILRSLHQPAPARALAEGGGRSAEEDPTLPDSCSPVATGPIEAPTRAQCTYLLRGAQLLKSLWGHELRLAWFPPFPGPSGVVPEMQEGGEEPIVLPRCTLAEIDQHLRRIHLVATTDGDDVIRELQTGVNGPDFVVLRRPCRSNQQITHEARLYLLPAKEIGQLRIALDLVLSPAPDQDPGATLGVLERDWDWMADWFGGTVNQLRNMADQFQRAAEQRRKDEP